MNDTVKVKNIQEIEDDYLTHVIQPGEYYTIQTEFEREAFANNSKVNQHLWSNPAKILITDGTEDLTDPAEGDKWLKGNIVRESKPLYEDKNNPGNFNNPTHDSNKYANIHIRKDYSEIKGANTDKAEIKDIWTPADGKHVDITDIILYGYINEPGKNLCAEIEIKLNDEWKAIGGVYAVGVEPFHECCSYQGHIDTDAGDGIDPTIRLNVSGSVGDDNCRVKARTIGHEEN